MISGNGVIAINGQLAFFYYHSYDAGTYVAFHKHHCYEIVYYVAGNGTMQLDGQTLCYTPGSLTMSRPDFSHDERHEDATDVIFFGFTYDDDPVPLRNGLLKDTPDREMLRLIQSMKTELIAKKPHFAARANLLLNEVIVLAGRAADASVSGAAPEQLQYAVQFIDENFAQAINLQTLAELSGYSDDHFRHLFKQRAGLPPTQYIIRKRLDQARMLLTHSSLSISDIGAECGFSTTSQFIDMFKRAYGATPLKFRSAGAASPISTHRSPPE